MTQAGCSRARVGVRLGKESLIASKTKSRVGSQLLGWLQRVGVLSPGRDVLGTTRHKIPT
jgi:hypothetical protein